MGDELVKELKTNKDLGWKFVDRKSPRRCKFW